MSCSRARPATSADSAADSVESAAESDAAAVCSEVASDAMSEALEALRVQFPQASESELRRKLRAHGKGKQTGCVLQ